MYARAHQWPAYISLILKSLNCIAKTQQTMFTFPKIASYFGEVIFGIAKWFWHFNSSNSGNGFRQKYSNVYWCDWFKSKKWITGAQQKVPFHPELKISIVQCWPFDKFEWCTPQHQRLTWFKWWNPFSWSYINQTWDEYQLEALIMLFAHRQVMTVFIILLLLFIPYKYQYLYIYRCTFM